GRNGGDFVPAENCVAAGFARGLLAGGDDHRRRASRLEGALSRRRGGGVRQYVRRSESGKRLLLHVGERSENRARDSAGAADFICSRQIFGGIRRTGNRPAEYHRVSGFL